MQKINVRMYNSVLTAVQEKIKKFESNLSDYIRVVMAKYVCDNFESYCDSQKLNTKLWEGNSTPEFNGCTEKDFMESSQKIKDYKNNKFIKSPVDFKDSTQISLNADEEIYEKFKNSTRGMSIPVWLTILILEDIAVQEIYESYRSVNDKEWWDSIVNAGYDED